MQSFFGILTIGVTPVQISATKLKACKLQVQLAPGATGNGKVGVIPTLTNDNTTPGTFLSPNSNVNPDGSSPSGDAWSVQSYCDANTLDISQYYFHGTHAGDLLMYNYHVN